MPASPKALDDLLAYGPRLFAAFDRQGALVRAMLHGARGPRDPTGPGGAARREIPRGARPGAGRPRARQQRALLAGVTALCPASGWESMRESGDASGAHAGRAVEWELAALIHYARGRANQGE